MFVYDFVQLEAPFDDVRDRLLQERADWLGPLATDAHQGALGSGVLLVEIPFTETALLHTVGAALKRLGDEGGSPVRHSTVTVLARLRGLSTSHPRAVAMA